MDGTIEPPPEPFATPLAPVVEQDPLVEAAPAAAPEKAKSSTGRSTLIAALIGVAVASAAMGWRFLHTAQRQAPVVPPPALAAPEQIKPIPTPAEAPPAAPTKPAIMAAPLAPAAPPPGKKPAAKRRRAAKAKRSIEAAPVVPAAPAAPPAEVEKGFLLPGIPRPVSKSAVAAPPGEAAPPAPASGDDPGARQVREQFDFCSQLLTQGAYADHFDTCLCADARSAAPYRGRRDLYASALKKTSAAGKLEARAEILSVDIDGNSAVVKSLWKTSAKDSGRETPERWRLEDGLWCRAP